MKTKVACLIYEDNLQFLDHLAPLCYFFKIPLITNETEIASIAKKYYPKIDIHYIDNLNVHFFIAQNFDSIITCITKKIFDYSFKFHQDLYKKDIKIIWCPHGNSDKGKTCLFFEGLKNEKSVLIYGKKMMAFLKAKKVLHTIKSYIEIGNYRLVYFQKFIAFFKKIIEKEIKSKLPSHKINILYSPTWKDAENSSSFEDHIEILLKKVPSKYNLIIKLHPNLLKKFEIKIELLKQKYKSKNILFLDNFPLIYPLIDFADIYLGDFSSVGYDFLCFQKPMFFLKPANKKLNSDLFDCGHLITNNNIFEFIEKNIKDGKFQKAKKKLYNYTFKDKINMQKIKNFIFK